MSTPPRSRLSNTKGTSMAWQAPSTPPMAVDGRSKRYMDTPAVCASWASASRIGGLAEDVVGHHGAEQAVGVGLGAGRAVQVDDVAGPVVTDEAGDAPVELVVAQRSAEAGLEVEQVPLVGGRARHQAHPGGAAVADGVEGDLGEHRPVDHRLEGQAADGGSVGRPCAGLDLLLDDRLTAQHLVDGQRQQRVGRGGGEVERAEEALGHPLAHAGGMVVLGGAALGDGLVEQALGRWRAEERADAHAAGGLAEDRDVAGVAAEAGDVVAHPTEGGDLVADAVGARAGERRVQVPEVEEPEGAQPVVDRDDHHVAVPGQVRAVVPRDVGRSRPRTPRRGSTP